jgi:hypothetical protein
MRGTAQDAVRQLRDMGAWHAANAGVQHIPAADREAWNQSSEVLRVLADRAEGILKYAA